MKRIVIPQINLSEFWRLPNAIRKAGNQPGYEAKYWLVSSGIMSWLEDKAIKRCKKVSDNRVGMVVMKWKVFMSCRVFVMLVGIMHT
jgi:hypothetical protein